MQIVSDLVDSSWRLAASVVGVGTFDGVHLAHQRLIAAVCEHARAAGLPSVVLTFDPLPAELLRPGFTGRLCSLERKLEAFGRLGPDWVAVIRFDRGFAGTEPEQFVDHYLLRQLGAREVIVGFNFTFGYRARGTPSLLHLLGHDRGFATYVFPPFAIEGEVVSSSAVRARLGVGDVEGAARLLDAPYVLEGVVVRGDGRGARLGFPTANVRPLPENSMIPGRGVYSGSVRTHGGEPHDAVINIGVGPTFGGTRQKVEVHLLGFQGDLLGQRLEVSFTRKLRDERKFASEEDLARQIAADVRSVRPSEAVRLQTSDLRLQERPGFPRTAAILGKAGARRPDPKERLGGGMPA